MLLQLYVDGCGEENAVMENRVSLNTLRPIIAKSNDVRFNKDLKYLFAILERANLITCKFVKRTSVIFQLSEYNQTGEYPPLIAILKCNRHILECEHYNSNVPFSIYCLLRSLQYVNFGRPLNVSISMLEMQKRLNISLQTLDTYKSLLQKDGLIYPILGKRSGNSYKRDCNEYVLYNYNERKPEKYAKLLLRQQEYKKGKEVLPL
jgi:hypothetical protein